MGPSVCPFFHSNLPQQALSLEHLREKGYLGTYSVASLVTFLASLLVILGDAAGPASSFAHEPSLGLTVLSTGLKVLGIFLMGQALSSNPRPNDFHENESTKNIRPFSAQGIVRITRHGLFVAFAIIAVGKLLVHQSVRQLVYYAMFPLYTAFGISHQDARHQTSRPKEYFEQTSAFPFWAIISGKQSLTQAISEFKVGGIAISLIWAGIFYYFNGSLL